MERTFSLSLDEASQFKSGPNTEFGELKITTSITLENDIKNLEIHTNLTNSVQTPDSIELSMIIVKLESV